MSDQLRADDDVHVVRLSDLNQLRGRHVSALVVIDATRDDPPTLPQLAQIVLLRRRLRGAGGDLVIAASPATAALLRGSGLHWTVPCCLDVSVAIAAVRRGHARGRTQQEAGLASW